MNEEFFPERSKKIREDAAKWTLIFPKLVLEYLCFWPESKSVVLRIVGYCILLNVTFVLITHTAYFLTNTQDIVQVAEVLTTVNVVLQSFVRMSTLVLYKKRLRSLLHTVWHEFWPSNILQPIENRHLKKTTLRYFTAVGMFSMAAFCTTPQFMYQPLILGVRALPLMLKLPLSFMKSPTFELLYVWQCCTCLGTTQCILVGFDLFFTMLVWNCSSQFKILRILLGRLISKTEQKSEIDITLKSNEEIQHKENVEIEHLINYIQYHQKLIAICNELEDMFKYVLLIQLLDSALAICVCCFAAVTVPILFAKMMTFGFMYIMQLFIYCAFGNELQYQSTTLAYATFQCGWHYSANMKLRKLLIMLIQKSQEDKHLTARGFTIVNYASCFQVIKMAFSFYTVLDAMKRKKELESI